MERFVLAYGMLHARKLEKGWVPASPDAIKIINPLILQVLILTLEESLWYWAITKGDEAMEFHRHCEREIGECVIRGNF